MRKLVEPRPDQPFRIRAMTRDDLAPVLAIEQRAFKHPWSPALLERELSHEWSTILLAEEAQPDGSFLILGFAIVWLVHDELHVLNVATDPPHRRRGVARAVMDAAVAKARDRKCTLATLEVRRSNEGALTLYKDMGFRPVGIRPNYYVDEREDAIVMLMDL
ncbi:MAG: ribosomal protein S18-alanine N-acetyltransferase [Myxococcota bacterium]|nr:ribosomal protein S18-alanine N-acetyltransferase [Myxococcota bacterium]